MNAEKQFLTKPGDTIVELFLATIIDADRVSTKAIKLLSTIIRYNGVERHRSSNYGVAVDFWPAKNEVLIAKAKESAAEHNGWIP